MSFSCVLLDGHTLSRGIEPSILLSCSTGALTGEQIDCPIMSQLKFEGLQSFASLDSFDCSFPPSILPSGQTAWPPVAWREDHLFLPGVDPSAPPELQGPGRQEKGLWSTAISHQRAPAQQAGGLGNKTPSEPRTANARGLMMRCCTRRGKNIARCSALQTGAFGSAQLLKTVGQHAPKASTQPAAGSLQGEPPRTRRVWGHGVCASTTADVGDPLFGRRCWGRWVCGRWGEGGWWRMEREVMRARGRRKAARAEVSWLCRFHAMPRWHPFNGAPRRGSD